MLQKITTRTNLVFTAFLALTLSVIGVAQVDATTSNTRADAWGTLEVSGGDWLGGNGVDIFSNGAEALYTPSKPNNSVLVGTTNVVTGEKWQCVEMINRLYLTRGWISNTWSGDGNELYDNAPSDLSKEANGEITTVSAGDVVSFDNIDGWGHAAVVDSVVGTTINFKNQNTGNVNSSATISNKTIDMNGWDAYTVIGIIHSPSSTLSNPTDVVSMVSRSSTSIDALNRNPQGQLVDVWWDASLGWHTHPIYDASGPYAPASDPKVVSRTPTSMNAFYRDVNNRLASEWWDASSGWHNQVLPGASNMAGDPAPIARSATSLDVFYRTTTGVLVDEWWDASVGWQNYPIYGTPVVAGNPKVISRTPGTMDVIYRDINGNLVDTWWTTSTGWQSTTLPGTTGTNAAVGDPTVISRSTDSVEIIYRSVAGQFVVIWWAAGAGGWHNTIIYGTPVVSGNPSAITRTPTTVDVFYKDQYGRLIDTWWDASVGWHSTDLPGTSGNNKVSGDPTPIARTPTQVDVLYRAEGGHLVDEWWDASIGWNQKTF